MLLMMLLAQAAPLPASKPVDAGQCVLLVSHVISNRAPDFGRAPPNGLSQDKAVPVTEPAVQTPKCKSELPGKLKRKKNQRLS
jgi:hypothetical protein